MANAGWEYMAKAGLESPPSQPQGWLRILTNFVAIQEIFATNA
jgi:hypothetical protein